MNSKRVLYCILCIIMCVALLVPQVYAGQLGRGGPGEYGDRRYNTPPDDGDHGGPGPSESYDPWGDKYIYVPHYIYIKGQALEDPGYSSETLDVSKLMKPVAGVQFKAGDAEDFSAADGSYELYPSPGEYELDMKYGDLKESGDTDPEDVLKYNGYDYYVAKTPSDHVVDGELSIIREEVIRSKKGAAQVFIVLDCSYSMRHTYVMVDGARKTRLQNAIDASKTLIEELLAEGDNIYIGIVAFAGNNFRAASINKDKDFLFATLDSIPRLPEDSWAGGTNIVSAFDKAISSFYVDKSNPNYFDDVNRNIVLVSDGIPTADGETRLYADDSEEFAEYLMLNFIGPSTRKKMQDTLAEKINVMTLITKSEYEDEAAYADSIFQGAVTNYDVVNNEQELADAIRKDIKEWIQSHIEEITEFTPFEYIITGKEDPERRALVDSYFNQKPFYYNVIDGTDALSTRTSLFKDALDDATRINKYAEELSEKTYMTAVSDTYHIDEPREETLVETVTEVDDEGVEHTYNVYTIHYNTGYDNQDLYLMRRQEFPLVTKVTTTGIRVTLNTGEILNEEVKEFGTTEPLVEWIDDDIALGATVEIEYTIRIKNNSSLQVNELELLDYLPENFYFNKDSKLISEQGVTNKDLGWNSFTLDDMFGYGYVNNVSYTRYNRHDFQNAVKLIRDNAGKGANGFFIAPGGTFEVKIVASRVFSNGADFGGSNIFDACEVLGYDNNADRRMSYSSLKGDTTLLAMYPGDTIDVDYSVSSNGTIISPPTGEKDGYAEEARLMMKQLEKTR